MLRFSRRIASKNSSLSRTMARSQRLVEAGERLGIGRDVGQFPGRQPLAGEVLDEGGRLRVGEHPAHLGVEVPTQLSPSRQGEQLVVGHAAPEEVRQPRGQLVLADRVARSGLDPGRVQLDAEQEVGPDEHPFEGQADAVLEPLALLLRPVVELQDAFDFLGPDRAAEGPARRTGRRSRGRPRAEAGRAGGPSAAGGSRAATGAGGL